MRLLWVALALAAPPCVSGGGPYTCPEATERMKANMLYQEQWANLRNVEKAALDAAVEALASGESGSLSVSHDSEAVRLTKIDCKQTADSMHKKIGGVFCWHQDVLHSSSGGTLAVEALPVCAPTDCSSAEQGSFACEQLAAYVQGRLDASNATSPAAVSCGVVSVNCQICNGCFIDEFALGLGMRPWIAIVLLGCFCVLLVVGFGCLISRVSSAASPSRSRFQSEMARLEESEAPLVGHDYYMPPSLDGEVGQSQAREEVPETPTFRARLLAFYEKHNPGKAGEVDGLLAKYSGQERQLCAMLYQKYGDRV